MVYALSNNHFILGIIRTSKDTKLVGWVNSELLERDPQIRVAKDWTNIIGILIIPRKILGSIYWYKRWGLSLISSKGNIVYLILLLVNNWLVASKWMLAGVKDWWDLSSPFSGDSIILIIKSSLRPHRLRYKKIPNNLSIHNNTINLLIKSPFDS
jgi:hypothetical protein